ncbi:hypothetical protein ACIQM4_32110 [Streptomyces sp. NPDC091272]|uniref:hypothetical protein n=1 Tax=Streptomyces sp. NPDC091272 TaxID=3365981 RepID=UPI0037FD13CE
MTLTMGGRTFASEGGFRTGLLIGCGVALASAAVACLIPAVRAGSPAPAHDEAPVGQAPARA